MSFSEYSSAEVQRGKEGVGILVSIPVMFILGFILVLGYVLNISDYTKDKESDEWIVGIAEYSDSTYEWVSDSDGGKKKQYTHYFWYEAPDGKKYEYVLKSDRKIKKRVIYEILIKKNQYFKAQMKPFEALGVAPTFIFGIILLLIPIPFIVYILREFVDAPSDWRDKYDL